MVLVEIEFLSPCSTLYLTRSLLSGWTAEKEFRICARPCIIPYL